MDYTFEEILEYMKKDPDWDVPMEERERILAALRTQLVRS